MSKFPDEVKRLKGTADNGIVDVRSFDEGAVVTMGAFRAEPSKSAGFGANYFLDVPGVSGPTGHPGVPVVFGNPDDVFEEHRVPAVVVRRNSMSPAMQRWHSGAMQFRAPAADALGIKITNPYNGKTAVGWDRYEQRVTAYPFDFSYTLRAIARNRGGGRNQANALFLYLSSMFPPYCVFGVFDSKGDLRRYHATCEYSVEDETLDVTERYMGYSLDLNVEGELDLTPNEVVKAVQGFPVIGTTVKHGK